MNEYSMSSFCQVLLVTSAYEWKILEWDENAKQTIQHEKTS